MFARQFELLAVKILLALAHRALQQRRLEVIEADFTDRHQARIVSQKAQLRIQRQQIGILRLGHAQRMNAQRIAV